MDDKIRLQKLLADVGIASRRASEELIIRGEIQVNNKVATLGLKVGPKDDIRYKGRRVKYSFAKQGKNFIEVIAYHKNIGELCSKVDDKFKLGLTETKMTSVYDKLPKPINGRWVSVGRLDINTSGLLLFTNNGQLANALMHPKYEQERRYAVRVFGEVKEEYLEQMLVGVELDDGFAKFDEILEVHYEKQENKINKWFEIGLKEGRNREVRRIFEFFDLQVSRLIRISYAGFKMPSTLNRGGSQRLDKEEVKKLLQQVGM